MQFQQNKYILACLKLKTAKVEDVILEGTFPRCTVHNREMTMFCRDEACKQIICHKCKATEHVDHAVVEIEEQQEECNTILNETMKYVKERTKELYESKKDVNDHYNFAFEQIEHARRTLIEKVNKSFDEENQKLQQQKDHNLKQISGGINDFEGKIQTLRDVANAIQRLDKPSLDTELIVTMKQSVVQSMLGIQNMKGLSYVNRFYPGFSMQLIENLTHGVVGTDLPLAIKAEKSPCLQDTRPGKKHDLLLTLARGVLP